MIFAELLMDKLKQTKLRQYWRKINNHNFTKLGNSGFSIEYEQYIKTGIVTVGNGTYGTIVISFFGEEKERLCIGNYCSIGGEVLFILGGNHNYRLISQYPYKVKYYNEKNESYTNGSIIISDDVWVGQRVTILSGVHIGQGAVVAAGAVVTKDVPPYAVVGGVPAKVIKYRFEQPVIDYMLTLDYSALTEALIREHVDDLYTEIDCMELEEVKKLFDWFPKKSQDNKESR